MAVLAVLVLVSCGGEEGRPQGDSLVLEGDSLTSLSKLDEIVVVPDGVAVKNVAKHSETVADMTDQAASQVAPRLSEDPGGENVLVVWGGTNDLYFGATGEETLSLMEQYGRQRQAEGWKVVVVTVLPRSDKGTPADFEAQRSILNEGIRSRWQGFADGIADVAADPNLGHTGAETNSTYYDDSLVHLNAAGSQRVADLISTTIAQAAPQLGT